MIAVVLACAIKKRPDLPGDILTWCVIVACLAFLGAFNT